MSEQRSDRVVDLDAARLPRPRPSLESSVPVAWVQGTLALDVAPHVEPPARHLTTRLAPRPSPGQAGRPPGVGNADVASLPRDQRAALEAFATRWVTAAVQIAMADRPVTQMLRNCTPEVYADLSERSRAVLESAGPHRARIIRPVVMSVRTCLVRTDALEVAAHVRHGPRSRAVAARLEHVRGRWQGVAVTFG
jgi:hypothetical protein